MTTLSQASVHLVTMYTFFHLIRMVRSLLLKIEKKNSHKMDPTTTQKVLRVL